MDQKPFLHGNWDRRTTQSNSRFPGSLKGSQGTLESYHRDACISLFTATLFTVARKRNQPRCLSIDKWIRKMWFIHNGTLFRCKENLNCVEVLDEQFPEDDGIHKVVL